MRKEVRRTKTDSRRATHAICAATIRLSKEPGHKTPGIGRMGGFGSIRFDCASGVLVLSPASVADAILQRATGTVSGVCPLLMMLQAMHRAERNEGRDKETGCTEKKEKKRATAPARQLGEVPGAGREAMRASSPDPDRKAQQMEHCQ